MVYKGNTWQLTKAQRELVNNCFEEHQYETAIATLDQLCTSEFNPWPPHIRQLIYLSLQPMESLQDEIDSSAQFPPSKILKRRQSQLMNFVSMKTVVDAQKVLLKYLHTSQPDELFRALPRRRLPHDLELDHDEAESTVARRASYIMQSQDCWELLSKDFSLGQKALSLTLRAKPKAKHQSERFDCVKFDAGLETGLPLAVQENAWPLLDWLVSLFEHDEQTTIAAIPCSLLLADQLIDQDGKTHLESPIDIIALCLQQTLLQRRMLASRLLSLLINLTSTEELEFNKLTVALYTRVSSLSQLHQVLSQLGHSTNVQALKFKIGVYQMVISGLGLPTSGEAQKPQPRIRPPAKKLPDSDHQDLNREFQQVARPSIPSALEILRLVETHPSKNVAEDGFSIPLVYKFQLLLTYGTLQRKLGSHDRDPQWTKAVREVLPRVNREIFGQQGTEAGMYQRLLENQINGWRQALDALDEGL